MENIGYAKGETCNREGCTGIIDEHPKEGSCSCHIHPPCGYCTTDSSYCPACEWCPDDDVVPVDPEAQKKQQEAYARENERWQKQRDSFYNKLNGKEPVTELEIRHESHTHFSQKLIGVFPPNSVTSSEIEEKIKGTFGGRFEYFDKVNGKFSYIAYTD